MKNINRIKYVNLLSLSLISFTLFGCYQSKVVSQTNNQIEASNTSQEGKVYPQQVARTSEQSNTSQEENYPQEVVTKISASTTPQKVDELVDERNYETVISSLDKLTQGCKQREVTQEYFYTVCILNGNPVTATQSLAKGIDDYRFWFSADKLIAHQDLRTGKLLVFNYDGTLSSMFYKNLKTGETKNITNISKKERELAELTIKYIYENIVTVFNL